MYAKAYCPTTKEKGSFINAIDLFNNFINFKGLITDVLSEVNDGRILKTFTYLVKNTQGIGSVYKGVIVTTEHITTGIQEFLSISLWNMKQVSRGMKKTFDSIISELDFLTIVSIVLTVVADIFVAFIDLLLNCITLAIFFATPIATLLYEVLKFAAGVLIKGALIPIIGFFAHIISFVIGFGLDWAEERFDIKRHLSTLIAWVFEKSSPQVSNFINVVWKL